MGLTQSAMSSALSRLRDYFGDELLIPVGRRMEPTALALSLREAATNIQRHSGASGVTIRVRKEPNEVVVEVADNGRGGRIVPGNGLNGMRERLGGVGGTLSLTSSGDGGTLLRASVPLAA